VTAIVVALALAVVGLAVLVAGLLRSHAEILRALHELGAGLELDGAAPAAGSPGPLPVTIDGIAAPREHSATGGTAPESLVGTTLDDEAVALPLAGRDTLVAFLSSGCTTCQSFWQSFATPVTDVPGGARLVVVTRDLDEESESALRSRAPRDLPLLLSTETWDAFEVPGSPYFVYVDGAAGRIVGEGSMATWDQVVSLLGQARDDDAARGGTGRVAGDGAHRRDRDDAALLAAGIGPGHPSLAGGDA
jgi:hypothetical protein